LIALFSFRILRAIFARSFFSSSCYLFARKTGKSNPLGNPFHDCTYYKKNLQPFDSSIDLQGLEPSFLIVEREKFKNVKKNTF
jgi:hypothetical protein